MDQNVFKTIFLFYNYFVDIYHIAMDFDESDVRFDPKEALGFRMASFAEISQLDEEDAFMHYRRIKTALTNAGLV